MYKLFSCMLTKVDHYKLSSCMQHHLLSCLYILFSTSALKECYARSLLPS